jgi:tRNA pseudouridine55 synthase
VVDKPEGITSHDVVAFARRTLGQDRIGHTGTLDPFATGVLPLACGRATRLVRFMSARDKSYEATIRFGLVTDTYDVTGTEVWRTDQRPVPDRVTEEIEALRRERLQHPPPFSAKKIAGTRAYDLARQQRPVDLPAVPVQLRHVEIVSLTPDRAEVRLTCSAGFYVRSLAHDLGARLGVGACLEALRRTRSGDFTLAQAVTIGEMTAGAGPGRLIGLRDLLTDFEGVTVGQSGRERVRHGLPLRDLDIVGPVHAGLGHPPVDETTASPWVRILDETGMLVGLGQRHGPSHALRASIVLI